MSRMRPAQIADVIDGRYAVELMLGQGNVGIVYSGRHCELGQPVAIKFMHSELAQRYEAAEAFRRQARRAAAVEADHVCTVLDVSTLETGIPYIVMEYLEGHDLRRELSGLARSCPYEDAVDYVLQACDGVASLLVAGIVHRDLRPSKLFLTSRPDGTRCVKLLDPGSSGLVLVVSSPPPARATASELDPRGAFRCVHYLAPEQLASPESFDPRVNVWALGAMLYHLLSGNPPYRVETPQQLLGLLKRAAAPSLVQLGLPVPRALSAVLDRALARDPGERLQSVAELARALAPFAPERSLASLDRIERLLPPGAAGRPRRDLAHSIRSATGFTAPGSNVTTSGVAPLRSTAPIGRAAQERIGVQNAGSAPSPVSPERAAKRGRLAGLSLLLLGLCGVAAYLASELRHGAPPTDAAAKQRSPKTQGAALAPHPPAHAAPASLAGGAGVAPQHVGQAPGETAAPEEKGTRIADTATAGAAGVAAGASPPVLEPPTESPSEPSREAAAAPDSNPPAPTTPRQSSRMRTISIQQAVEARPVSPSSTPPPAAPQAAFPDFGGRR